MTRHRRHGGGRRADPDKQACDRWLMETIIKAPYIRPPDHPLRTRTGPAACRQPRAPPYPRKSVEPANSSSPVSAINAPET